MSIKFEFLVGKSGFLVGTLHPCQVRAPSHWYSGSSKVLNPSQFFAFSAEKHLDIAKTPGIPGYPQQWAHFYARV
ncbi:hypothetical protein CER18_06885 [Bartonella tribocorum]|uniref:Uncharacterized protein n=1 Tax=Bartonella tribocorum TaxID=85701 RepID=A0A2M6UQL7_9HYPH|nr:hypothetical protein CER18_06885 [Bartonella tribocorum]